MTSPFTLLSSDGSIKNQVVLSGLLTKKIFVTLLIKKILLDTLLALILSVLIST